jgi:2,4-dienoyl-CoA reductase-like NADH-dependent reductase (Old Yellow Enzyme family)
MDCAFNIFRGSSIPLDTILEYNPKYRIKNRFIRKVWKKIAVPYLLKKVKTFTPMYNLPYAIVAKKMTDIPIICVGGFRGGEEIINTIKKETIDFISLSRPLLCEPDFILKIKADRTYTSHCINCNTCAVMVDSPYPTVCYYKRKGDIV